MITNLELWQLGLLCVTTAITPFSLLNYIKAVINFFKKTSSNQNLIGRFVDWFWLSSVLFLSIILFY